MYPGLTAQHNVKISIIFSTWGCQIKNKKIIVFLHPVQYLNLKQFAKERGRISKMTPSKSVNHRVVRSSANQQIFCENQTDRMNKNTKKQQSTLSYRVKKEYLLFNKFVGQSKQHLTKKIKKIQSQREHKRKRNIKRLTR